MATIDDLKYAARLYDRYAKLHDDYNERHLPYATVDAYEDAWKEYVDFERTNNIVHSEMKQYREYEDL